MDMAQLRGWWWSRQGLDGSLRGKSGRDALLRSGWARSVGGANPYLTIFSRTGATRESIDQEAARVDIHELPSARGCTYVLPRDHFTLALMAAQGPGEHQEIVMAKRFLDVTDEELDKLSQATLTALEQGTLDPKQIKAKVGDLARNLGEEGKKRGAATTLPMVLGRMQTQGFIRRVPQNGRLDQQRYKYQLWKPNPFESFKMSRDQALTELAKLYFQWIGPASIAHFQWFSGLSGKAAKDLLAPLSLVPASEDSDVLMLEEDLDAFRSYKSPKEPSYNLIAGLDSLFLLRREVVSLVDEKDRGREAPTEKSAAILNSVLDLFTNAIIDRGRLVGLWDFDPEAGQIVWVSWVGHPEALKTQVSKTEAFIRDQLGDCRSFSLDSPESRKPKLAALRALAEREGVTA